MNIKKIVAREGLILIGIILAAFIMTAEVIPGSNANTSNAGYMLFFFGYPIYLVFRFVIWAIRTLKGK
ncbi:MAG: hypothetical protein PHO67_07055 [Candidatus Omnitrophica bacterium]|nr:hypothetical protein [Candidatus Omnitrophota bacterium]